MEMTTPSKWFQSCPRAEANDMIQVAGKASSRQSHRRAKTFGVPRRSQRFLGGCLLLSEWAVASVLVRLKDRGPFVGAACDHSEQALFGVTSFCYGMKKTAQG